MSDVKNMALWYRFDDPGNIGKDSSQNGRDASACGSNPPVIEEVGGRNAVRIKSDGSFGS